MTGKGYPERLALPIQGNPDTRFFTKTGALFATGYERIVIGQRGPYVEFLPEQIAPGAIEIPRGCDWRKHPKYADRIYYVEWRSVDGANVKVYEQVRPVDYADYIPGKMYASPTELFSGGVLVLPPLVKDGEEVHGQWTLF